MQIKEKLVSAADDLELSVLTVLPEEKAPEELRGVVQIVHGMSEYKERYLPLMEFLAAQGFGCVIHDHRGHGESVKSPEDYGYMYEAGPDALLQDIAQVNAAVREKYAGLPLIMFAHSMGSLAARSLLREQGELMDMLILSGPPCKNEGVEAAIRMAAFLKKRHGGRYISGILENLSFAGYVMKYAKEKNRFAWLNSDSRAVAEYTGDPGCGFPFTVDGFQTLYELLKRTYRKDGWKCTRPDMPILFLAGSGDPCIGNSRKFQEEMDFLKAVGFTDVQGILYENMRHEICNEPGKQKVFADILRFLEKKGF